ncbi:MAG: hypothetical protein ACRDHS_04880 [Actinomycetota bacterium]
MGGNLSQLLTGLEFFGISRDELVDDFEVGVAIPRGAVDSKLPELGEEFIQLQKILAPFEELAGEGRPDFEVRSIASSEFSVFLITTSGVIYGIAKAFQVIVETYDKILDTKRKRAEMAKLVPEEMLSEVDAHASTIMEERLVSLAEELVEASTADEARKNELKFEVRWSLNKLANRVDAGYSVDIRTPEPSEQPEEEGAEEDSAAARERARLREVRELAEKIRRLESPDTRILQLPESSGDESELEVPPSPSS